jgi:hypothetical protein
MTNKEFVKELIKWARILNIGTFYFHRDDTLSSAASICAMNDDKPYLRYNLKSINQYGKYYHEIIFHEFGHIINKHYLRTHISLNERVKGEYIAEKYSFEMMQKYFPKRIKSFVKRQLKMINDEEWTSNWPVHQEAFKRVYLRRN